MKHISKEIVEGNKLLLDFMGVKPRMLGPDSYSWSDGMFFSTHQTNPEKVMEHVSEYAKYSTDWNWIMEVVKQISLRELPHLNKKIMGVFTMHNTEQVKIACYKNENLYSVITESGTSAIFEACVKYVKWYNFHNKN